jgi:putative transposase
LACILTRIDGAYGGPLVDWVKQATGWVLQIVKRSDDHKGFVVLPKRWIVEITQPHYP